MTEGSEVAAPIVVGVSGSAMSQLALQWSLREAADRGCAVRAVHVWTAGTMADFVWHDPRRLRRDSRSLLRHAIARARTETGLGPAVVTASLPDPVAPALAEAARGAEFLVLGARGRALPGTFGLGQIGLSCLGLAGTPTVVVSQHTANVVSRPAECSPTRGCWSSFPMTNGP
ncbi:universal stress protein [Amycolatopsis cihanbeyliensis]|uniref:Nucleotide-binding universal stress UspA family protein n=1 Tax=Amycolatopsis cihanbeyliensis TaxID=1128664 RepID=A0A542DE39_AMYCI|nr:universal stress protein [Amycolatopsis cihanbeyliensis]TQJ01306.1 nucleotide-binding universal stress UspA family protein [Amycolatopsis cihanbeyliensis]